VITDESEHRKRTKDIHPIKGRSVDMGRISQWANGVRLNTLHTHQLAEQVKLAINPKKFPTSKSIKIKSLEFILTSYTLFHPSMTVRKTLVLLCE